MPKKLTQPKRPGRGRGEFSTPGDMDTLMRVYQGLVDTETEYGKPLGTYNLSKWLHMSSSRAHVYIHHLRNLGIINFETEKHRLDIKIIVRKDVEKIIREVYGKRGFLVIHSVEGYTGKHMRRPRKVEIFEVGPKHIAVATSKYAKHLLKEWHGQEINNEEEYWSKDYTISEEDFDIKDIRKEIERYGKEEYTDA